MHFACAKVESVMSWRKIKTTTCLLENLPIWPRISSGRKMKRWLEEIMLGNEGKANHVNHDEDLAGPSWLYTENQTRMSQTRRAAQHCHPGQRTNREALAEWVHQFNLPTVQPAKQSRERQRKMRVLGGHPGHGWKGLEVFEKTKGGMEWRTKS